MSKTTKAYAFEFIFDKGKYLSDGVECMDTSNEGGDVTDLSQALVVFGQDFNEPTKDELFMFVEFMKTFKSVIDWEGDVEPSYVAVIVELTEEQVKIIKERNDF